ncbi:MAG: beta-lactamase [Massilia sp.]|nr:beta-lactamase [Massilia sp.]
MKTTFTCLALSVALLGAPAFADPRLAQQHGVASDRLERLHRYLEEMTAPAGARYLGAVSLIARDGVIVDVAAYGYRDIGRTEKLKSDAIFRIYSMSKTVTAAAVIMLVEEGKIGLEDPVARFIPQFKTMQVIDGGVARPAAGPITVRQLLTHTAGFAVYGAPDDPATAMFMRADVGGAADLAGYVERLAKTPLGHDPGREFHYDGVATQVAARIVEIAAHMRFDDFLRTRLFEPLRMPDTGFEVAPAQRGRIAAMTVTNAAGRLVEAPRQPGELPAPGERMRPYFSAAGGLYSTAADYARFAQMLLNGGSLDGVSVLSRKGVELMMRNHLTQLSMPIAGLNPGESFGLGGSVVVDAARRGRLGSDGQFGWSGAGGTWYTIDPRERLVAVLMTQHLPVGAPSDPRKPIVDYSNLLYQSLQPLPRQRAMAGE